MPSDPAYTRAKLLEAAVEEFSEHGFAGARIERISGRAGVNRERMYAYFGNKRALFETVLADRLASALDAAVVRGSGPQAVARFASDYFDACRQVPALPRLVAWEGLELDHPITADERRQRAVRKVDELWRALPNASREEVEDLLLTVVTMCHGWVVQPNLGRIIAGDEKAGDRRRAAVAATARAIAAPHV